MSKIIVYDLETGGLSSTKNAIVEIAAVAIDGLSLQIIDEYESLISPYELVVIDKDGKKLVSPSYDKGAMDAHGIPMSKIEKAPEAKVVVKEFAQFLTKHKVPRQLPILCGHNIDKFDNKFLDVLFTSCRANLSKFVADDTIDTLKWAQRHFKKPDQVPNHKLGTMCNHFGIELIDGHRAMNDVKANAGLVVSWLKKMTMQEKSVNVANSADERPNERFRRGFVY